MSDSAAAATAAPAASPAETPAQPSKPENTQPIDDVEIDLGDGLKFKRSELKERMTKKAQWEQMSHQRYQQAAEMKRQVEAAMQMIKQNPAEFLRQTGIDPEDFAKSHLQEKLKMLEMTPEQRELMETRKQLEEAKKEKEKIEQDKKQAAYQQQVEKFEQYFDQQFAQSMTQVGLPKNPRTIKRMAEKVEVYLANEMPVDVHEIAREVKQEYIDEYGSTFSEWDDDTLGQILKDKARERARGLLLKELKSPTSKAENPNTTRSKFAPRPGKKILGLSDLTKQYERILPRR